MNLSLSAVRQFLAMSVLWLTAMTAGVAGDRAAVAKLHQQGNWKEALEEGKKLITEVSDAESGKDVQMVFQAMQRLNNWKEFDVTMEAAIQRHEKNGVALLALSDVYQNAPHDGSFIDNQFSRGGQYWQNGGQYANVQERDRVRAMQLGLSAIPLLDEKARVFAWQKVGGLFRYSSAVGGMLGKTDLSKLPEVSLDQRGYHGGGGHAPVDEKDDAIFYQVPESFEAAKNDGERWRWSLQQRVVLDASQKVSCDMEWAQFLHSQFGVQTLQDYFWIRGGGSMDDEEQKGGIMQLHTLKDNETICRLATGVKRFELPDDQNFMNVYKHLWEMGYQPAADQLVQVYINRRQFTRAKELLTTLMTQQKTVERERLLKQIVGNWGMFEFAVPQAAGKEPSLRMLYRNAKKVNFTVYPVNEKQLQDDVRAYLKSNPARLDWNAIQQHNLLHELVNGDRKKYLGEAVSEREHELKPRENHWDVAGQFSVPVTKPGVYMVKAEMEGGVPFFTLVWMEDMVVVSKQTAEGLLMFVTDAVTGEGIAGADLDLFGYQMKHLEKPKLLRKMDVLTKEMKVTTGDNGVVVLKGLDSQYQWLVKVSKGERVCWPGNPVHHGWYGNQEIWRKEGLFGITNQPVYRPGTEVKGKFWMRAAAYDLDQKQSKFAGQAYSVEIFDPQGNKLEYNAPGTTNAFGGGEISLELPEDAMLGMYTVNVIGSVQGSFHFRVEEYKKPEFEVLVDAPKEPVKLGEVFKAKVKAVYYHGAPVTEAKVKVKVTRKSYQKLWFPYGRWDWLYGGGYGWLDVERAWYPGWSSWGCRCPYPFWDYNDWQQPELLWEKEMEIGEDGTVEVTVDTSLAKLVHGHEDHSYEISAEVVDASRRTIFSKGQVIAARQPYQVTVWLNRGYAEAGQQLKASIAATTLDGREVPVSGEAILYHVKYSPDGKSKESEVKRWKLEKSEQGLADLDFRIEKAGQYRLVAEMVDAKERKISGAILVTVYGDAPADDFRFNDLELLVDKRTYAPGEKVNLRINTNRPDSTVMLVLKEGGKPVFVKTQGRSASLQIPVELGDMPNFFIEAVTVSDAKVYKQVREVIVPPEKRVLNVEVLPNGEKYKPQAKGKVKLRVTDGQGEPVSGECVLAIYDKALEYISGGSNVADIKEFYWKWRRPFRGGFMDSLGRQTGNVVVDRTDMMQFLGVFGQTLGLDGDLIEELDAVGGSRDKGDVRRNMALSSRAGGPPAPTASPAAEGAFADGTVAKKGDAPKDEAAGEGGADGAPEVMVRKDFADAIKWQGSVVLDERGEAVVDIDFPDNLTTWKIKVWGMAHGTRVGEGQAEVITSKDLIVRLQAPRFFIEKDEVVLSAVVHNYHKDKKQTKVVLELEGGTLTTDEAMTHELALDGGGGEQRVDWRVKVKGEGEAIVRMKVLADDDADAMEMRFPVYVHGMARQEAWSRVIEPAGKSTQIEITVPAERRPEESRLEIRYSPSIAGAIVDALPYLVEYPYGCTEQTLNRFVPTVITQKLLREMDVDLEAVRNKRANLNPQELGDDKLRAAQWRQWQRNPVFNNKEVEKMVREGVARLVEMQLSDGGWGWFSGYGEYSSAHTTAVVVHGLLQAKKNGVAVPEDRLQLGVKWLQRYEEREAEHIRMWEKRKENIKQKADEMDAFVRFVLAENGVRHEEMQGFLFRDKNDLSLYAKGLLGLSLHMADNAEQRDEVIRNIEQFLVYDEENQSAYLDMRNGGYWWCWYGSEFEAHAFYLKLLAAVKPNSKEARGIVKYLVNNRKHATYWHSTRDTAYCIEAIADYMRASGETVADMEVDILFDGKLTKQVKISKENLFSFDNKFTLAGDILSTGKHTIEIRKRGEGPLYTNAYLSIFTKEDFIPKAGLEVKVERRYYKLVRAEKSHQSTGERGQIVDEKSDQWDRIPLKLGDTLKSGDRVEVELIIESKNDYEYLMFSDWKAAGFEAEDVRSGYQRSGSGMHAYMEVRDEKVSFFVRQLGRGKHNLTYCLRAEIPGKFSALPALAEAMYAPELKANSDEMKLHVEDK